MHVEASLETSFEIISLLALILASSTDLKELKLHTDYSGIQTGKHKHMVFPSHLQLLLATGLV